MDTDRLLRSPSPMAGLKPMTDETRKMPPFGSPKGEGQHDQASRRSTGGIASSQVDPPQGGTGARARRHGRGRGRSPRRLPECLDGPAPLAFVRPPAAPREMRLNGFLGSLVGVARCRVGGGLRRPWDRSPQGMSDATKVGQYPCQAEAVFRCRDLPRGVSRDGLVAVSASPRLDHP